MGRTPSPTLLSPQLCIWIYNILIRLTGGESSGISQCIPELKALLTELRGKVADEWEDVGIQLDIDDGKLKQINADKGGDSKACLREMLRVWLSRVAPPPSWSAMADALNTLGHEDIATHLRTRYCQ